MPDRRIVTPFFIGRREDALLEAVPGWQVNAPALPNAPDMARLVALYEPLAVQVALALASGERPVSLAGDCLSALGVAAGLARGGLAPSLLWFDAHGDFNTWETTPSGFLGGMPLAMLVGLGEQTLMQGLALAPLDPTHVLLSDARDLDPGEREAVASSRMRHVDHIDRLLDAKLPEGPLYVHFDTDIVDPADSPGQNYLAPDGPSAATLGRVFQRLAGTGRVAAVSVSAWAPAKDTSGHSRRVSLELLETLLA